MSIIINADAVIEKKKNVKFEWKSSCSASNDIKHKMKQR